MIADHLLHASCSARSSTSIREPRLEPRDAPFFPLGSLRRFQRCAHGAEEYMPALHQPHVHRSGRGLRRWRLCTENRCGRPWERGRLARCPRVAAPWNCMRSFKRASRREFVSRDQASSGRAARAPRRRPSTRADFWCKAGGGVKRSRNRVAKR